MAGLGRWRVGADGGLGPMAGLRPMAGFGRWRVGADGGLVCKHVSVAGRCRVFLGSPLALPGGNGRRGPMAGFSETSAEGRWRVFGPPLAFAG